MALARLGDAEEILYMQRSYSKLQSRYQELQSENKGLIAYKNRTEYQLNKGNQ